MNDDRIAKLTEAQRACLRLVARHWRIKDIARELNITPTAVTERLRVARLTLDVSSSIHAGRALLKHEALNNTRDVDIPSVVESDEQSAAPPGWNGAGSEAQPSRHSSLREDHASYGVEPFQLEDEPDLSLRIPWIRGSRDDLKPWQIIIWCLIAGALAIAAAGLLLKIILEVGTTYQQELRFQAPP